MFALYAQHALPGIGREGFWATPLGHEEDARESENEGFWATPLDHEAAAWDGEQR